MSKPWRQAIDTVGSAGVRLGVVLLLLVPLLRQPIRSGRDGIPTLIALLALVWISKRSFSKKNSIRLLATSLTVFIVLQILIATNQASLPFSDFQTYRGDHVELADDSLDRVGSILAPPP